MLKYTPFVKLADDLVLSIDNLADMPGKIIEGPFEMRSNTITSTADGRTIIGVWECTPGAFSWEYPGDELQVILHGSAEIEFESGATITIRKGDLFVCSQGERCVWHVHDNIRKVYYISQQ